MYVARSLNLLTGFWRVAKVLCPFSDAGHGASNNLKHTHILSAFINTPRWTGTVAATGYVQEFRGPIFVIPVVRTNFSNISSAVTERNRWTREKTRLHLYLIVLHYPPLGCEKHRWRRSCMKTTFSQLCPLCILLHEHPNNFLRPVQYTGRSNWIQHRKLNHNICCLRDER